jgi:hypothetical protein
MRYVAKLVERASVIDAKSEIEVCGGSDIDVNVGEHTVTFTADVDDIPSVRAMSTIESVEEVSEPAEDAHRH